MPNETVMVPYIVHESEVARQERHIRRLFIVAIVSVFLTFASNMVWLYVWNQYDYTSEEISIDSGSGNANYIGGSGDINNG